MPSLQNTRTLCSRRCRVGLFKKALNKYGDIIQGALELGLFYLSQRSETREVNKFFHCFSILSSTNRCYWKKLQYLN